MGETIFAKIIRKEIPAQVVFESETVLAFKDINPQAPVHVLIIPKINDIESAREISSVKDSQLLGEMFDAANSVAKQLGIFESGFRLVLNSGLDSGQEVPHIHIHLLGGRKMNWPPG
ncbi:MAG: histidine triad (HIT) protein [Ignavibacteria bacterium]|nr:MAG: histidine triad (HIT) protein [Ignavibacteria bacterium]KAF0159926.1 MAG: histidine triad (HIT) protein [Ignavibacteria bacterium]